MREIPFFVLDSFTETPFQGNPAGVFLDRDASLSAEEMRQLAGEIHLESAFVLPGEGVADFRLRYFTGVCEVPFCGHDTVATAVALARSGWIEENGTVTFALNSGMLQVRLERPAEASPLLVTLIQRPAELRDPLEQAEVARVLAALGYDSAELRDDLPVQSVSTGTPWLYLCVRSRETVDRTPTDFPAIAALSRELGTFGCYVFTLEQVGMGLEVWSRCYAPVAGLNEDPVTGSASGGLGVYLGTHQVLDLQSGSAFLLIRQGFAGGRGGQVRVVVQSGGGSPPTIEQVEVQGTATPVAQGVFTLAKPAI